MSHHSQRAFLESCSESFPEFFRSVSTLEIGSGDINGSIRRLFSAGRYVGIDVVAGPGVDVVGGGHEVDVGKATFDVALSCECFEHNPHWRQTLSNMVSHLRPGGLLVITCAAPGRPEHGTKRSVPLHSLSTQIDWDYYGNVSKSVLAKELKQLNSHVTARLFLRRGEADLYLIGLKGPVDPLMQKRLQEFAPAFKSDKSRVMQLFLACAGVLEAGRLISPYMSYRCLQLLQRAYIALGLSAAQK